MIKGFKNFFGLGNNKNLEEEMQDARKKLSDKEQVKRMWENWPDREEETTNTEEGETSTLEIPVYEIRVDYKDGETEVIEHESNRRPDPEEINSFRRYNLGSTSYRFDEDDLELKFRDIKTQKISSINRDLVAKVTIVNKNTRPVDFTYDVETIEITESKGSRERRRITRYYTHYRTQEEKIEKLLEDYKPEELKEQEEMTVLKAKNVEVAGNE